MTANTDALRAKIEQLSRRLLRELMMELTHAQRLAIETRIFPSGVPASSLPLAVDICDRTIMRNAQQSRPGHTTIIEDRSA